MNAVEIEEAVSALAEKPFDPAEFPFLFLEAFGNKATTIKRLRSGSTNKSDLGGVLQNNNIHIVVCDKGSVDKTVQELEQSAATKKHKVKFVLATDGEELQAIEVATGEPVACKFDAFPDHFGFFLALAGISTVKQIRDNSFDVRATGRLNRLYIELLKHNPEWGTAERKVDMNHFMARLIFCFFAEDTDIFPGKNMFTETVAQMSASDSKNTHEVVSSLFLAMNTKHSERDAVNVPRWAAKFPYVNGGLFSGSVEVPLFSKIARSYLVHIGNLDWTKINPDIFGSMIQAVTDDEERGSLGLHYTSVPNILKVLNPLFLDDLREQLEAAGDNRPKLKKLHERMSRIRVFDPACGSGNFLVIAYKEMRLIEAEIRKRRKDTDVRTLIPLTNFRGIELRDFPAEIARLALIIAEFQCDQLYRGQKEALAEFLPLDAMSWITCGNALRLDWLSICPPTGTTVRHRAEDLFSSPLEQSEIDFENEGGETYICGNPPFKGTRKQGEEEKRDLELVFGPHTEKWKNVDYVGAWLLKAAVYNRHCEAPFAFVATNSLCQGQQVPITWATLLGLGFKIRFAHPSFTWANLASNKAGVTVVVVGVDASAGGERHIFEGETRRAVPNINPYLTHHNIEFVDAERRSLFTPVTMDYGVYYSKSAGLILDPSKKQLLLEQGVAARYFRRFLGSSEYIKGKERYCLWLDDNDWELASTHPEIAARIESVRKDRLATTDTAVNKLAQRPHQFRERKGGDERKLFIPIVSSEAREYFPAGLAGETIVPTNKAFFVSGAPTWALGLITSRLHTVWIATVCGRLRSDYSYSNTLGWNTFPVPKLTEKNKVDLEDAAASILLERERHFPATLAELYDPEEMPSELRLAHSAADEVVERIYMGRRFKNDSERLEMLFSLYEKMKKSPSSRRATNRINKS